MPQREEMGVIPNSPLAQLLGKLGRSDRRLLLAAIQAKPGKRRDKLQRDITRRLRLIGLA